MTKTTDPIEDARLAAEDARHRAEELRAAVIAGDEKISAADLQAAEADANLAGLRYEAAQHRQASDLNAARLVELNALRRELEHDSATAGKELVKRLKAVEHAIEAFLSAAEERDTRWLTWKHAAEQLGVPELNVNEPTSPEHGGLGFGSGTFIFGTTRIGRIDAAALLGTVIADIDAKWRLRLTGSDRLTTSQFGSPAGVVYTQLAEAVVRPDPWTE